MKLDLLNKKVGHRIDVKIQSYETELLNKVKVLDTLLTGLMSETKEEFLIKPSPLQTRQKIQHFIDHSVRKQPKGGVKMWADKSISEFDISGLKRYTHFEDHQGDFITKSGYKIDNYNLDQPSESYGNDRYRRNIRV